MEEPDGERSNNDLLAVWCKRYDEAVAAGMDDLEARDFADSSSDIGYFRWVVRRGCPPELLARIVL